MFDEIERLIREVKITPADVAENLMPKKTSLDDDDPAGQCLSNLIGVLENVKEKADAEKKAKEPIEEAAATNQTVESKATEEEEAANEPSSKESKTMEEEEAATD
ncbi:hypothetical protein FNV43_RR19857 [Rhamnella rubrinervis]|uniref:AAA+ ATPase At3g28540-like C-terminal domain-containing protein n=1 Tax=Rhamnella rubrinervis TaxID=2594499 RepID=A0A8K0E014_9ROSA|nr:hypothetical protein FNV43_RR19857 [Rhamnella rubrinervis]